MTFHAYRRPVLSHLGRLSFAALFAWAGAAGAQPAVPASPPPGGWAEPPSPPVEASTSPGPKSGGPIEATTPPGPKAGGPIEVAAPARAQRTCAEGWMKRTYQASKASIVRIDPIGMSVSQMIVTGGFVYPTGRHIVTHSDADDAGRGVWVTFYDGRRVRAHLSAIDRGNDLALFEIEGPASAPPLALAEGPLEAGAEIVSLQKVDALTTEGDATLDTRLQAGRVANEGGRVGFRFDGGYSMVAGLTVFDCEGKVVALRWQEHLVPAQKIRELLSPKASEAVAIARGGWSAAHVHAGALTHFGDGRFYGGLGLGMSLVADDRWQVRFGFGGTLSADPKKAGETTGRQRTFGRLQLETGLGYRFLLAESVPLYFVPQAGVVGRWDLKGETNTRLVTDDPGCFAEGGGSCEVKTVTDRSTSHRFGLLPTIGASVLVHGLAIGYQYQIDLKDSRRSTHQIFVGLEF